MTTKEAADALGIKPVTVRAAIKSGKLRAVRHGRDWHITPAAVEAYRRQYDRPGFFVEGDYLVMTVAQFRRWIQARWAVSGAASA